MDADQVVVPEVKPAAVTRNEWLIDLIETAEAKGFMVLDLDMRSPGAVTLLDHHGTEIRINDQYGINLKAYIDQLTAIPRTVPKP